MKSEERKARIERRAEEDFLGRLPRQTRHAALLRQRVGQVRTTIAALPFRNKSWQHGGVRAFAPYVNAPSSVHPCRQGQTRTFWLTHKVKPIRLASYGGCGGICSDGARAREEASSTERAETTHKTMVTVSVVGQTSMSRKIIRSTVQLPPPPPPIVGAAGARQRQREGGGQGDTQTAATTVVEVATMTCLPPELRCSRGRSLGHRCPPGDVRARRGWGEMVAAPHTKARRADPVAGASVATAAAVPAIVTQMEYKMVIFPCGIAHAAPETARSVQTPRDRRRPRGQRQL